MSYLRTCADPGCGVLVEGGRCVEHAEVQRVEKVGRDNALHASSDWRWVYRDPRWRALRRQVKQEQAWCAVAGCFELTHDVDHIRALQDGGAPFDRDNVQGLCKKDHASKTNAEVRARAT